MSPPRGVKQGPRRKPPRDAAELIKEMSSRGYSKLAIARRFTIGSETLTRWLAEFPHLQDAWDEGREREHQALYTKLFDMATKENNVVALLFLLKTRHGYREGDQIENGSRVNINFQLPGALALAEFGKVIEHERINPVQSLPDPLLTRS